MNILEFFVQEEELNAVILDMEVRLYGLTF